MADESTVSTTETPQDRNAISVVTEENQAQAPQPPAEPPPGAPNAEKPATSESDTPPAKPKTRRRSSERKIAALQRQLAEAETAGTARDKEVAELRAQVDQLTTSAAPAAKKPRLQDFKTAEEYADAHADWKTGQEPPAPAPAPAATPAAAPQTSAPTPTPEVTELYSQGEKIYGDDFKEVLDDKTLPLSASMADHIFDSDRGPDLVMWLDENREDAQELFHMRPKKLAERLTEIEKTLDTPPAPTPPADPPRGDNGKFVARQPAPPPPPGEPVGGNVQPGAGEIREGLPMDDYADRRRAQMAKNRTR